MTLQSRRLKLRPCTVLWGGAIIALCFFVISRAWIEEDAFITFRVVDNFLHGYGLRWNIDERVQVYTNPLWMLIHIPFQAVFRNIIISSVIISSLCLLAIIAFVSRWYWQHLRNLTIVFFVPLMVSDTQVLFLTSGLEYALLALLFVCFWLTVLNQNQKYRWFWLVVLPALSTVCRIDSILIYLPLLSYLAARHFREISFRQVALGTLPAICWFCFSFWYYGFALPNTYYAKLETGIPRRDYIMSGIAYVYDFALGDPVMAVFMMAACAAVLFHGRASRYRRVEFFAVVGMMVYTAYVVYIGGYQLSLRMMALPSLVAILVILNLFPQSIKWHFCAALVVGVCLLGASTKLLGRFRESSALIQSAGIKPRPWARYVFDRRSFPYKFNERAVLEIPNPEINVRQYWILDSAGQIPYYEGPNRFTIEVYGLCDPLLARLPSKTSRLARVGHVQRNLPVGYEYAIVTGDLSKMHPDLSIYYEQLRTISRADLWSLKRFRTVVAFNLGFFNAHRTRYLNSLK